MIISDHCRYRLLIDSCVLLKMNKLGHARAAAMMCTRFLKKCVLRGHHELVESSIACDASLCFLRLQQLGEARKAGEYALAILDETPNSNDKIVVDQYIRAYALIGRIADRQGRNHDALGMYRSALTRLSPLFFEDTEAHFERLISVYDGYTRHLRILGKEDEEVEVWGPIGLFLHGVLARLQQEGKLTPGDWPRNVKLPDVQWSEAIVRVAHEQNT